MSSLPSLPLNRQRGDTLTARLGLSGRQRHQARAALFRSSRDSCTQQEILVISEDEDKVCSALQMGAGPVDSYKNVRAVVKSKTPEGSAVRSQSCRSLRAQERGEKERKKESITIRLCMVPGQGLKSHGRSKSSRTRIGERSARRKSRVGSLARRRLLDSCEQARQCKPRFFFERKKKKKEEKQTRAGKRDNLQIDQGREGVERPGGRHDKVIFRQVPAITRRHNRETLVYERKLVCSPFPLFFLLVLSCLVYSQEFELA